MADPGEIRHLEVTELDASPDVLAAVKLVYPNATLIDLGNGSVRVSFVGTTASDLACTGGSGMVTIGAASCPAGAGLVLTTTSATTAEWQTPASSGSSGSLSHFTYALMGG